MTEDTELLRRYLDDNCESSFEELVKRHLPLVYSAAYRRAGGDAHMAEDISQTVFATLARKARSLSNHPALGGWLYKTTQFATIDALRERLRRNKLEQRLAMELLDSGENTPLQWETLRPVLDEAMSELKESDRNAVLLRYFEGCSFAELGRRLRLNENTARMRVDRALERLRGILEKHGLKSTGATLATMLSAKAIEALPSGLAESVTSAVLTGTASHLGLTALIKTIPIMTKAKILGTTCLAVAGLAVAAFAITRPTDPRADKDAASRQQAVTDISKGEAPVIALSNQVKRRNATTLAVAATPEAAKLPAYKNCGQATPADAYRTFAWASDQCDIPSLSKLIAFTNEGREAALKILAAVPEDIRKDYSTPEELYAFFIAADAINYPPPPVSWFDNPVVNNTGLNQVGITCKAGSKNVHTYIHTAEGWKFVIPDKGVEAMPCQILKGEALPKTK